MSFCSFDLTHRLSTRSCAHHMESTPRFMHILPHSSAFLVCDGFLSVSIQTPFLSSSNALPLISLLPVPVFDVLQKMITYVSVGKRVYN